MKELVEYLVKSIVSKPDEVKVSESKDEGGVNIDLEVSNEDMGIVIGRAGQTIKALRKLIAVKAMAENVRVRLNLIEPEGSRPIAKEEATQTPIESADQPD